MVSPNGVGDDLVWETKAFQARHLSWCFHDNSQNPAAADDKLAMLRADLWRGGVLARHVGQPLKFGGAV